MEFQIKFTGCSERCGTTRDARKTTQPGGDFHAVLRRVLDERPEKGSEKADADPESLGEIKEKPGRAPVSCFTPTERKGARVKSGAATLSTLTSQPGRCPSSVQSLEGDSAPLSESSSGSRMEIGRSSTSSALSINKAEQSERNPQQVEIARPGSEAKQSGQMLQQEEIEGCDEELDKPKGESHFTLTVEQLPSLEEMMPQPLDELTCSLQKTREGEAGGCASSNGELLAPAPTLQKARPDRSSGKSLPSAVEAQRTQHPSLTARKGEELGGDASGEWVAEKEGKLPHQERQAQITPVAIAAASEGVGNATNATSTVQSSAAEMIALVEELVAEMVQLTFHDRQETVLVLKNSHLFEGAQVVIKHYGSAAGEFSVHFYNLGAEAAALLSQPANQLRLQESFQKSRLTVHILGVSQSQMEQSFFTHASQSDSFRENSREGREGQRDSSEDPDGRDQRS